MFKLSVTEYRWRISKDNEIILSGVGTASQAQAIASAHGIVLTKFHRFDNFKRVA